MKNKHKVHFKKAGIGIIILCLMLMVYALVTLAHTRAELRRLNAEADALQQQVTQTTEENAALEYKIAHSDDADIVEQAARDELGLVLPGEKVFYDTNH